MAQTPAAPQSDPNNGRCYLLEVPNEIIFHIYDCLDVADIPNFASSCKAVNTCLSDRLAIHRSKVTKYERLNMEDLYTVKWPERWSLHAQSRTTIDVMRITDYCSYLFKLRINAQHGVPIFAQNLPQAAKAFEGAPSEAQPTARLVTQLMSFIGYHGEAVYNQQSRELECADPVPLSLVLWFCTNIRSITFSEQFWELQSMEKTLKILQSLLKAKSRSGLKSLENLRIVRAEPEGRFFRGWVPIFQFLSAFATFPAMRILRATNFEDRGHFNGQDMWKRVPVVISSITEVVLTNCEIRFNSLSACLGAIQQLKKFVLTTDVWDGSGTFDLATRTINRLLSHEDSLEQLQIGSVVKPIAGDKICSCLSLQPFTKLRHASIDVAILDGTKIPTPFQKPDFLVDTPEDVLIASCGSICLDSVFPSSIETVILRKYQWTRTRAMRISRQAVDQKIKANSLPNLRSLKFGDTCPTTARDSEEFADEFEGMADFHFSKADLTACWVQCADGKSEMV